MNKLVWFLRTVKMNDFESASHTKSFKAHFVKLVVVV